MSELVHKPAIIQDFEVKADDAIAHCQIAVFPPNELWCRYQFSADGEWRGWGDWVKVCDIKLVLSP